MAGGLKAIIDTHTYEITRQIAAGGMGTVYEATQYGANGFRKTVAIKTIAPQFYADDQVAEMFIHEAKLVADLVHENIVQIYQLGRTPDEGHYIVMEYVQGVSLYDFLRLHRATETPIPTDLAVFIASRICRGLAYAHHRQDLSGQPLAIVHRDVCPNNILITTEGLPKLTDFGIAVAANRQLDERQLMGKAAYMSPEHARKQKTDFHADQFALGAVLFELLTGQPIRQSEDNDTLLEHASTCSIDWDHLPDTTPSELQEILRTCLAASPRDRYKSTNNLAHELEYFIYKDGYGPTIQKLEAYLRRMFPYLYRFRSRQSRLPSQQTLADQNAPATMIMEARKQGP